VAARGLENVQGQVDVEGLDRGPKRPWARVTGEIDDCVDIRELLRPTLTIDAEIGGDYGRISASIETEEAQLICTGHREVRSELAA